MCVVSGGMPLRVDRRASQRFQKLLDATIERRSIVLLQGQHRTVRALVIDVSREGLGCVATEPLERESQIKVTVDLSHEPQLTGADSLSIAAVVRDCTQYPRGGFRVGVQFLKVSGRELESWADFIKKWSAQTL